MKYSTQKSNHTIAAIFPVGPEYSTGLLEGAVSYASENNSVRVLDLPYRPSNFEGPDLSQLGENIDGAIVWLNANDLWAIELVRKGFPVVNTSGCWRGQSLTTVAFSGREIEQLAVDHLASRKPAFAAFVGTDIDDSIEFSRRRENFLRGMSLRGIPGNSIALGPLDTIEDRIQNPPTRTLNRLKAFLDSLPARTAIWCQDDFIARLLCTTAEKRGLSVPGDLFVLGLGDFSASRTGQPLISSIPLKGSLIGRSAAHLLHQKILDLAPETLTHRVSPPPVVERESSASLERADSCIESVKKLINNHACEGLTVNDIVAALPICQFTLNKRFMEQYGITPGEEIRSVKLQKAQHFLRTTSLSVERVAELCGFAQQGKFSKFFKRECGISPSDYRKGAASLRLSAKHSPQQELAYSRSENFASLG